MPRRLTLATAASVVALTVTAVMPGASAQDDDYEVLELDSLPGSTYSCAIDINEDGVAAGYNSTTDERAVYWDADGSVTDIGTLPGGAGAEAEGINENGDIAGTSDVAGGDDHAFFYDMSAGTMTDIHPPTADPGTESEAKGINDSGRVSGNFYTGGELRGFVYDPSGPSWTTLGTLGGTSSDAKRINNAGFVNGSSSDGVNSHAFRWNPNNLVMSDLGTLSGGNSRSFDINESGEVVGYSDSVPFLYDGSMAALPLPAGTDAGEAIGMNDAGDAIGETFDSSAPSPEYWPTLWLRDQDPVLLPLLTGDLEGYSSNINNAGVGVGCSVSEQEYHAVLWIPPEPPSETTTTTTTTTMTTAPSAVPAQATQATPAFTG